jgi:hypothetical protein
MTYKRFTSFIEDNGYWIRDESNFKIIATGLKFGVAENLIAMLNGLTAKNKVLHKEIERLKRQNEDILYNNAKNMELLEKENEQLKQVLGNILLEVKRDITITNCTGEIKVFINPNSYELISDVLRKYGALKEWYE